MAYDPAQAILAEKVGRMPATFLAVVALLALAGTAGILSAF